MLAAAGYYDGVVVRPLDAIAAKPNQRVMITILDDFVASDEIAVHEKRSKSNFFSLAGRIDIDDDAVTALRERSKNILH
ncbi:MAG: hypothetical protein IJ741_08100 [Schwartzia sp.]|nr:hypothetical protein [Schwartzia sp. (in: firmicutes)]